MTDIPLEKIPDYVENYLSIKDRVKQNDSERAEALKQLNAARKAAGFDTNTNDFLTASVEDLKALAADFSRPVVAERELSTVGSYNQVTGKWENPEVSYSDISRVGVGAYDPKTQKWFWGYDMEANYIGKKFRVGGLAFTVRESKNCADSGKLIFVATCATNKNLIWRGTEQDLKQALQNWVAVLGVKWPS